MKITKNDRKYIAQIAKKASEIFEKYGFCYGMGKEAKIPTLEELYDTIEDLVANFSEDSRSISTGRFYIFHDDLHDDLQHFKILLDLEEH